MLRFDTWNVNALYILQLFPTLKKNNAGPETNLGPETNAQKIKIKSNQSI